MKISRRMMILTVSSLTCFALFSGCLGKSSSSSTSSSTSSSGGGSGGGGTGTITETCSEYVSGLDVISRLEQSSKLQSSSNNFDVEPSFSGNFVPTTLGPVQAECVHPLPSGSRILDDGLTAVHPDGTTEVASACAAAANPQVVSNHNFLGAAYPDCGVYKSFTGTWTVPAAPTTNDSQTIYLGNGLQNFDCVIQPVLGWGDGLGEGWNITSWVCCLQPSTTGCYYSEQVSVNPGDSITGTLTLDPTGTYWTIVTADTTTGQSTTLDVSAIASGGEQWQLDGGVMEVYDIASCADYPASSPIAFTNITATTTAGAVQTPTFDEAWDENDGCGEGLGLGTAGQVSLSVTN